MKKIIMSLLMGLLLVAVAQVSYAEQCGCGGRPGMGDREEAMPMMHHGEGLMKGPHETGHMMWRKLMSLGLDEKQMDVIKAIHSRAMKDTIRKKADIEVSGIELRELLRKDPVDMSAVEAKLKKTEAMRTDLRLTHIKAMVEIRAVLTPEQRKQFKAGMMEGKHCGEIAPVKG